MKYKSFAQSVGRWCWKNWCDYDSLGNVILFLRKSYE